MGVDVRLVKDVDSFKAGSYSGFHIFRKGIAKAVGINLDEMEGYDGEIPWTGYEPFYELLDHSDCEGALYEVEDLLRDFKKYRGKVFNVFGDNQHMKDKYDKWIELLERAVKEDGYLELF